MDTLVELARILLAALFAVAGIAKLGSRASTKVAVAAIGVPGRLAPAVSVALPSVELALAVVLLVPQLARWGAMCAIVLLVSFSLAIGGALARGRDAACNCFGTLGSARVGWRSLARNAVLVLVAVLAAQPLRGGGLATSDGPARIVELGLAGAVLVEGYLVWQLFSQNRRLLERFDRLEQGLTASSAHAPAHVPAPSLGAPAPGFALASPSGGNVSLGELVAQLDGDLALVFANPGCGACDRVIEHLATRPARPGSAVAVIASSGAAEAAALLVGAPGPPLVLAGDEGVGAAYGIGPVPSAVLVDRHGLVASEVAVGEAAVLRLLTGRRSFELIAG